MFAIIAAGGKQYKVKEGDILRVEKLDAEEGSVVFDKVLSIGDESGVKIGAPVLEGCRVSADILGRERGEKIRIVKFRRRKGYLRRQGHRQTYTRVKIREISHGA